MNIDLETVRLLRDLWVNEPIITHALLMYREANPGSRASLGQQTVKDLSKWVEENIVHLPVDKA